MSDNEERVRLAGESSADTVVVLADTQAEAVLLLDRGAASIGGIVEWNKTEMKLVRSDGRKILFGVRGLDTRGL